MTFEQIDRIVDNNVKKNIPRSNNFYSYKDWINESEEVDGIQKFKDMLTLQPAIQGHSLDTEIEGKKIYIHLESFKDFLLGPEFIDRVTKLHGTFENFVDKLEALKPQIDRVDIGSEGVVDGSKMDQLITEQSYNDFKLMYNSLRGLVKGVDVFTGKPDTDKFAIILLVTLKGLPMLGNLYSSDGNASVNSNKSSRVGNYGVFAVSGFIRPKPFKQQVGTADGSPVEGDLVKENVKSIRFEIGNLKKDIIAGVQDLHYSSSSGAVLRMK